MGFKSTFVFKTKAGQKEGLGDVTSSLDIAEELRSQGVRVVFIINKNPVVESFVATRGFEYKAADSLQQTREILQSIDCETAILNQLNTSVEETAVFRKKAKVLVTIEDTSESAHLADLRFNVLYPIENSYSDFRFLPLSQQFRDKHNNARNTVRRVRELVVTQGGSDTWGNTPRIIRALGLLDPDITVKVIVGPFFEYEQELLDEIRKSSRPFKILRGEDDISDVFVQADAAISAAGNTLFELACLGVPSVVVCGEPFEVDTAARLQQEGFGINLGFGPNVDEKEIYTCVERIISDVNLRARMSERGKQLVDGRGAQRTARKILTFFKGQA